MKKTFLAVTLAIAIASCGDNTSSGSENAGDSSSAGIAPTAPSSGDTGIGTGAGADTGSIGSGVDSRSGLSSGDPVSAPSKMDTTKK